jgi:hypothetical protein
VRLLTTIGTLGAILLLGTACGTTSKSEATADASSPASAPAPSAAAGTSANTKQVCADVKQLNTVYPGKLTATFGQLVEEGKKGDAADEAAGQRLVDDMNAQTREWAASLQAASVKANSPDLRAAIGEIATKVKTLESENASMNDMQNIVQEANTTLAKVCG